MKKLVPIILLFIAVLPGLYGQRIMSTSDLLGTGTGYYTRGELFLFQDPALDTLISRHIEANRLAGGVDGYRIQVFRKGHRTAREEADNVMAKVISDFPELKAYQEFASPNFYIVRIGDFRTKIEATRMLGRVRRAFSDAYIVRQKINIPEITN